MRVSARKTALVGAAALALALSACGGDDDGDDEGSASGDGGGSVTVRGCNPENPLIPVNTNETCGGDVLDQLFSKLVRYDTETAEPMNEIAESIESEDNVTWTITLNDGWTFHDGTPITAQSFVDAWNYGAYGPNGNLNSYFFEPIVGYAEVAGTTDDAGAYVEGSATAETMSGLAVVDDLTFTATLVSPQSSFPLRLGYTAYSPMPEAFFEDPEAYGEAPIGSGPFQFESWEPNVEINLTAYPDYQGETQPSIDEVTFRIYENFDAAYNDLQADQLDIMPELPTSALAGDAYQNDLGERWLDRAVGVFQSVTFAPQTVDPSLSNATLRQAISMAIDRETIIEQIFSGTREAASGWVSPVVSGFEAGACGEFCNFDPDQARQLLDEAGGFSGPLTLSYNADADHQAWTEAVCNSISQELGIECVAQGVVDFATFRSQINAREMTGMFRTGWQMDYPSAENFLVPLYATGASSNDGDYSNPEFDAAVAEAATLQGEEAEAKYNEAEAMLAEDMASIPLWHYRIVAGWSTNVENVQITPFGTIDLLSVTTTS
ncbi:peptide ABC transporter substrate-binding protein [Jiangella asiatica]|uniref:ABC transporter substrate-binding protein n=1 Tax=Jiangella asiatica TaxID=2530372 RepID=A0A4R5CCZ7_9ACTN|nr:ABC transporter substrate-binding protein [Jiangella asiatica]TDD95012.1 ABC transporter substrate-binding protein [Jiangella asiatica]